MKKVAVGIAGITGRMGRTLVQMALEIPWVKLGAASSRTDNELVTGQDAGIFVGRPVSGVAISGSLRFCRDNFDVAIAFTRPEHTVKLGAFCAEHEKPMVVGTTAHSKEQLVQVKELAKRIPILMSPNMSRGINLLLNLLNEAARTLGTDAEVDVIDMHHHGKHDTPSGTAHALGEAVAQGRGQEYPDCASFVPVQTGELRDPETIYTYGMRMAGVVGVHEVIFSLEGEQVRFVHTAATRHTFAIGAMHAARWLVDQPPGLYTMRDMLAAVGTLKKQG